MTPIQKQIQDNFKQLEEMKRKLGIRPKMKAVKTDGVCGKSFDLRALNANIIKK